tara:strand:- start:5232 stop:5930 length:699 start_codon:yes stop_codon:yes gene_type:complete
MAWTAPRTYVDGEILTAAILNADIRDNLLVLDTHGHDGTSGDGAATLPSLDEIQFDHQSGLGAGESGHAAMWMASDGTVRTHNNGGSELTLADTTHTHTQAEGSEYIKDIGSNFNLTSTSYANTQTQAATPSDSTGSSQYLIVQSGHGAARNVTGTSSTYHIRLLKDSVQQVETSKAIGSTVETSVSLQLSTSYIALANSSTNFQIENKKSGTASNVQVYGLGTLVREMQCL